VLPLCRTRQTASFWCEANRGRAGARAPCRETSNAICAQAHIVEAVVVFAREAHAAFRILRDPFAEAVLDLLLFLARGNGLLLVDDAAAVLALVDRGLHNGSGSVR